MAVLLTGNATCHDLGQLAAFPNQVRAIAAGPVALLNVSGCQWPNRCHPINVNVSLQRNQTKQVQGRFGRSRTRELRTCYRGGTPVKVNDNGQHCGQLSIVFNPTISNVRQTRAWP